MIRQVPPVLAAGCLIVLSATPASAAQGAVKWFNAEKGFGFIAQDGDAGVVAAMSSTSAVASGEYLGLSARDVLAVIEG